MTINKYIYMMLAASLGLSACSTDDGDALVVEEQPQIPSVSVGTMQFTVAGAKSLQKTSLDDEGDVVFTQSDVLGVFSNGECSPFAVKQLFNDGYSALFEGEAAESEEYFALYPANAAKSIEGNVISAVLPSQQNLYYRDFDYNAALSAGYSNSDDKSFQLHNVTAMLAISCKEPIFTGLTVETLDKTPIAGDFAIEVDKEGGMPVVTGGSESKITVSGSDMAYDAVLVNLLPATIKANNLKLTIHTKLGTSVTRIIDRDVKFEAGHAYALNFEFNVKIDASSIDEELPVLEYGDDGWFSLPEFDDIEIADDEEYGYSTTKDGSIEFYPSQKIKLESDITFYLVKQKAKEYTVVLDANGGKFTDGKTQIEIKHRGNECIYYSNFDESQIPQMESCVFSGFYYDKDFSQEFEYDYFMEDVVLYARWEKLYTITYKDLEGNVLGTQTFDENSYWEMLKGCPEGYDGWRCLGWIDQDGNRYEFYDDYYPNAMENLKDLVLTLDYKASEDASSHKGWTSKPMFEHE